jgi:hypothetical protein
MDDLEALRLKVKSARFAITAITLRNIAGMTPEEHARLSEEYDRACAEHIAAIRAYESARHAVSQADRLLEAVLKAHK